MIYARAHTRRKVGWLSGGTVVAAASKRKAYPFSFFFQGFFFFLLFGFFFFFCSHRCFRVSLCVCGSGARVFLFSIPEAIKMMDDFPRGVPCRVVFFLSFALYPYSFLFFSRRRRFCHSLETGGLFFPRGPRLNVKQEKARSTAGRAKFRIENRNVRVYIYIYEHVKGEEKRKRRKKERKKRRVCVRGRTPPRPSVARLMRSSISRRSGAINLRTLRRRARSGVRPRAVVVVRRRVALRRILRRPAPLRDRRGFIFLTRGIFPRPIYIYDEKKDFFFFFALPEV